MPNIPSRFAYFALAALMGLAIAGAQIAPAQARSSEPSTGSGTGKCDKFEPGSRGWKKCMGQLRPSFEEAYALGYWLAKTGDYEQALGVLRRDADIRDPRVLTMIGYATRHLGHVDEALGRNLNLSSRFCVTSNRPRSSDCAAATARRPRRVSTRKNPMPVLRI